MTWPIDLTPLINQIKIFTQTQKETNQLLLEIKQLLLEKK